MIEYRLENWCIRTSTSQYLPPEAQLIYLSGNVYYHPSYEDGYRISTSYVDKVDGNRVITTTGSVYLLGEPDPDFIKYCKETGCHIPTKETPIKVRNV